MKKLLFIVCIFFCAQNVSAQIVEDFETWNPYSIGFLGSVQMNEPVGWSCTDSFIVGIGKAIPSFSTYRSQLIKESPGHAGTGAMKVATKTQGSLSIPTLFTFPSKDYPAIATNASFNLDFTNFSFGQSGGVPITFSPGVTTMYVKNTVVGGDSTFITATLLKQGTNFDTIIATADTVLSANISAYTQLTLPFAYIINNKTPDVIQFTVSSGNPLALFDTTGTFSVNDGTEIIIDNIEISGSTGIRQLLNASPIAKVYPTTGADILYVDLFKKKKNVLLEIHSLTGQLLKSEKLVADRNQISISNLAEGTYIFSLKAIGVIYQTGKFIR